MSSPNPAITDAAIERLQRRIGIPVKWGDWPRNTYTSVDSIREFAIGYGDDNPLFTDPDYAAGKRRDALLVPPLYFISTGIGGRVNWTEEQAKAVSGGNLLRGVGQYLSSDRWAFVRPVTPGIRLWRKQYLDGVELHEGDFRRGRVAVLAHQVIYTDAEQIFAVNERVCDHAERKASGEKDKYLNVSIDSYSDEQVESIYAAYENESRRGSERLTINNVALGDELPEIVKERLTVTDILCHHTTVGWGAIAGRPFKLAHCIRKRIPGGYIKNALNVDEVAQRCHSEVEFAQELEQPTAYNYGAMRTNWVAHHELDGGRPLDRPSVYEGTAVQLSWRRAMDERQTGSRGRSPGAFPGRGDGGSRGPAGRDDLPGKGNDAHHRHGCPAARTAAGGRHRRPACQALRTSMDFISPAARSRLLRTRRSVSP